MRALVFVLVLVVFATACGGEEPDADRVSLSYDESPINELLGIDIALRSDDLVTLERSAEERIVECMLANGFEYKSIDFASQFEPETGAEDPDSRNYAEANGYGISVRPVVNAPSPEELVDPNDEIREQLSPAELDAYQQALFGDAPLDEQPVLPEDRTGCVAESYRDVYSAQAELGSVEQFFGDFATELSALEDRFRSDPRFLELEEQWSTCMAEDGFAVRTREEIFVELERRMADVGSQFEPGQEPTPEMQTLMDEVGDWERSVAVADWDCTQPVTDGMRTLRFGYEALFLEEHGDRIDAAG